MPKNMMITGFKETRPTVIPINSDDQFRIGSPNKKSKKYFFQKNLLRLVETNFFFA